VRRILVTGGTGTLGSLVVAGLRDAGRDVALLSRRGAPPDPPTMWFTGDLRTGIGVDPALAGVGTVIHCASGRGDRKAAARLTAGAAASAERPHLIYISIVGVDRIPFGYYKAKLEVEHQIMASGLPWTILRATQFHTLIASIARGLTSPPIVAVPRGLRFQPISPVEVADRLIALATGAPAARVEDMGGPEIRTLDDLVKGFARSIGRRRTYVRMPVPGQVMKAFRAGENLAPEHAAGVETFEEFLVRRA
jgi:uncharacterized protein YbjT (DUF2867 family)